MDSEAHAQLISLEKKVDDVLLSVKKTQRYFQAMLWATVLFFVVPLIIALVAIPAALNSYLTTFSDSTDQAQQFEALLQDL